MNDVEVGTVEDIVAGLVGSQAASGECMEPDSERLNHHHSRRSEFELDERDILDL